MVRRPVRSIAALLALGLAGFACCRFLLPEKYAVNAPLGHLLLARGVEAPPEEAFGSRIRVPEGFAIGLYARVPGARFLRFTPAGDLLVSVPRRGRVLLLERDADGDGVADGMRTLLDGLDRPHGMDLHRNWLYVAESGAVGRVRFDAKSGQVSGPFDRVVTGLPEGGNHWTRTLRFGPDGWMYVSIGSSCNVCEEEDARRAALVRYRPDGSDEQVFATGLRNAVGFDWRPADGALYATDNGRDLLGDDFPPCELNRVEEGAFYGWPVANGDRIPDPDFGAGNETRIATSRAPVHAFRAHNAPLGITFLRGERLPRSFQGAALVALHGSWNRTRKDGYSVVSLHFGSDGSIAEHDFVWGFLEDEDVIGRPVDVAEGPDGAIYVSDDYAGAIYRAAWGEDPTTRAGALAVGAPAVSASAAGGDEPPSPAQRMAASARGLALYERYECASCHEPRRAEPGVVVVELSELGRRHDVEGLARFLVAPTPPMPVFPLSAAERHDLAVHLLSRFP